MQEEESGEKPKNLSKEAEVVKSKTKKTEARSARNQKKREDLSTIDSISTILKDAPIVR